MLFHSWTASGTVTLSGRLFQGTKPSGAVHVVFAQRTSRASQPLTALTPGSSFLHRSRPCSRLVARASSSNGATHAPATTAFADSEVKQRHVLSVFVADEPGLISKVSHVFTAAGCNIESLAVGLNVDTALFTIAIDNTPEGSRQLLDKLSSLEKVLYVEDLTATTRVDRELVLIKVRAPSGAARTEITELANIFKCGVVDSGDEFMTLVVTGNADKTRSLLQNFSQFSIVQLARTGQVSLKRGTSLYEVTSSVASSMDEMDGTAADISAAAVSALADQQSPSFELWESKQLISEDGTALGVLDDSSTLSIEVADMPGTLSVITDVIAERNINIQSLAVGSSEQPGRSRITVVIPQDDEGLTSLIEQIEGLDIVGRVSNLTGIPFVARELMIVKVRCQPRQRGEVKEIAEIFHGKVIDVSSQTMTLELQGREIKMIAAQGLLKTYGVLEVARTGRVAMPRDSGVNTRMLKTMRSSQVMM